MRSFCPTPLPTGERVLLAHGEGARLSRRLIRSLIAPAFDNRYLRPLGDAALLPDPEGGLALSTDAYVVSPLFFAGGDLGRLAVHGTINDLAVSGAEPLYLTAALVLEEGLEMAVLERIVRSMAEAASAAGVPIVAGDTKVVPRGAADGMFACTTGVGRSLGAACLDAGRIEAGDRLLVSGAVGEHGLAVLTARHELGLEGDLASDTAPLHEIVRLLLDSGADVKFLRDATRGGVTAVCHEIAEASRLSVIVDEAAIPVRPPVRAGCDLLGLDPLYIANEGKFLAVVEAGSAQRALETMRTHPLGRDAAILGAIAAPGTTPVMLRTTLGLLRALDEPAGAPLPRIC